MSKSRIHITLAGLAIFLSILACNLPGKSSPTETAKPTNTVESLIQPTSAAPATDTSVPGAPPTATSPLPGVEASPTPVPTNTPVPVVPTATAIPPTNTPVPTKTPKPTVSYVGPSARKAPSVQAVYLNKVPTLDGEFDEWTLDKFSVDNVVAGGKEWKDANDLSAKAMVGWDEQNLYIAARVKDDQYVQISKGKNIFKGDSIEILLDTDVSSDFYLARLSSDDFQLGIAPGNPAPGSHMEAYLWFPEAKAGAAHKVKIGATLTDDGYRIEAAIPWGTFGVKPRKGQHFGFAFSVSDNDKEGARIQQSMVSNDAKRDLADPTTWGDLTLVSAIGSGEKKRTITSIGAIYTDTPPTLDGSLDEWPTTKYSVNKVVFGKKAWDGAADLSGSVRALWDKDYLYLGVRVVDSVYVQNATGEKLFMGDSLEVLVDADLVGDFFLEKLSGDDYQLGISAGIDLVGNFPEAYLWFPKDEAGAKSKVKITAKPASDGYVVEVAIPWSLFGVEPAKNQHYGFGFSISDNDNPDKNIQQSMVSNVSTRVLADPTTWGDLTLIK